MDRDFGNQESAQLSGTSRPDSPLGSEIAQLDISTIHLSDILQSLEKRLSPLLRSPSPSTEGKDIAKRAPMSVIPEAIRSAREKVGFSISVIGNLLDRLEV